MDYHAENVVWQPAKKLQCKVIEVEVYDAGLPWVISNCSNAFGDNYYQVIGSGADNTKLADLASAQAYVDKLRTQAINALRCKPYLSLQQEPQ